MFQLLHIICLTSCLVDLDGLCRFHLGDTPHNLTEHDFERLACRTDGFFSGSDISV